MLLMEMKQRFGSVGKDIEILAFFEGCSLRLPTASVKDHYGRRSLCLTSNAVNKKHGKEFRFSVFLRSDRPVSQRETYRLETLCCWAFRFLMER